MDRAVLEKRVYWFGSFMLDPTARRLTCQGHPVHLTARPFDLLTYAVENARRVIGKDELLTAVWGNRAIEEGNLTQTISVLRRTLREAGGEDPFVTIPGRGYRFVTEVRHEPAITDTSVTKLQGVPEHELPDPQSNPSNSKRVHFTSSRRLAAGVALALALCGAMLWRAAPTTGKIVANAASSFAPPPHSVAVLPFVNLSGDPAQEYFSDGLSEELINSLSRIDTLRVVARTSAFTFKGKSATVAEIARQLNVGAVLEGSVRREGGRVRITTQLVDATTSFELWSASYDRDQNDFLKIQCEIAEAVMTALRVRLLAGDAAKLTVGGTENEKALEAYLQGMALLYKAESLIHAAASPANQASTVARAISALDDAISIDPHFAAARVGRSNALTEHAEEEVDPAKVRQTHDEARVEADRAILLAPNLASAHVARGYALRESLNFIAADKEFTLARSLAPNDASTLLSYAEMQLTDGHVAAAVAAAQLAAELDPLTASTYYYLASRLWYAGRPDDALVASRHGKALDQRGLPEADGLALYSLGKYEAARRVCADVQSWASADCLALVYHKLGRQADAQSELVKAREMSGGAAAYQEAEIYAQWGQVENAIKSLETAYSTHDSGLTYLKADPLIDPITSELGIQGD